MFLWPHSRVGDVPISAEGASGAAGVEDVKRAETICMYMRYNTGNSLTRKLISCSSQNSV